MNSKIMLTYACVAMLAMGASAMAHENNFKTTIAVGLSLTDGNSETLQANGSIVSEGEKERLGSVRIGAEANYGENTVAYQSETTVENVKVFGNARKTLSDRTFAYIHASMLYDDIARIDYRAIVGPGIGLYLVKNDGAKFSIESGVSYAWEDVADISDDYVALRAAQRLNHKLNETAKIWQSFEYLPQAEDLDNYFLNAELGIEAVLNSSMNLRLVLQDRYDSEPGEGLDKNDISLVAGISVKL